MNFPLFLNLRDRPVLVVGAGSIGLRRIRALLAAGARVTVTGKVFSPAVLGLAKREKRLKITRSLNGRKMEACLRKARLVLIATTERGENEKIVRLCRRFGVLVNTADQPDLCDFYLPSVSRKGKLQVAVSTEGTHPLLARMFREELDRKIRPESLKTFRRMQKVREKAVKTIPSYRKRRQYLRKQLDADFSFLK